MKKRNSEFHIFTQHFCQRNDLHDNSAISIVVSYFSDDQLLLNYLICCSKAAVNLNCDRLSAALPASEHWNFQVFPAVSSLYKHNMRVKKNIYIFSSLTGNHQTSVRLPSRFPISEMSKSNEE